MSRDIRSFFGSPSAPLAIAKPSSKRKAEEIGSKSLSTKRTAITDEAERPITPPPKRQKVTTTKVKVPIGDLDSELDSDPEDPLAPKYRNKNSRKRVVMSESDEDHNEEYFNKHSASRMSDSPTKKTPHPAKGQSSRRAVVDSDESNESTAEESETPVFLEEPEQSDEENFPSKRGRKLSKPKEKGIQKIDAFAKKMKEEPKKVEVKEEPKKKYVDSVDFFSSFTKDVPSKGVSEAPIIVSSDDESKPTTSKKQPKIEPKSQPKNDSKSQLKKDKSAAITSNEPALNLRVPTEKLEQWVDKYRPKEITTLIGQHTEQAPAKKLMRWLKDWPRHNLGLVATKKSGVFGNSAKNDGSAFRAALLSGPPGIGKTTTATVVCELLGLRYMELNASAARNKKSLEDKVSQLIHSRRVDEYFGEKQLTQKPAIKSKSGIKVTHVLIMDEVDGMSGNQDRAGVAEVIKFIKTAEIPIICICNDRHSPKVRSLANYCFDLVFTRPRVEQIVGRMMTIALRENLKIPKDEMEQIIKASNQDMRQSIYSLQLLSAGKDRAGVVQAKDVSINIFEAARQILTIGTDVRKKRDLFFTDYSLMPLFVQENYLQVRSSTLGKTGQLKAFRDAAEAIAMGDIVNKQIWSSQEWSLLPLQGMLSCVLPAMHLNGYLTGQISFPSFLGKRSNQGKRLRLLRELDEHMGLKMSGPLHAISTDYIPVIRNAILKPLLRGDNESVEEALDVYHAYDLVKEDLESINELGMWNENDDMWKRVRPAVKSSLTRALGKDNHKKHHATLDDIKIQARTTTGKRTAAQSAKAKIKEVAAEMEEQEEDDQNEIDNNESEAQAEILNAY